MKNTYKSIKFKMVATISMNIVTVIKFRILHMIWSNSINNYFIMKKCVTSPESSFVLVIQDGHHLLADITHTQI